jgi:hypothetical protein
MEDLVGSKNLKQGAVSCQLMIGKDQDNNNLRYLSTPKNKYGKGGTSWTALIKFNEQTNQMEELK